MKRIILVPTSHIAAESVKKIRKVIEKEKPDCVAIELDPTRLIALKQGGSGPSIKDFGVWGFLVINLMKRIQEWLGKKVGILPGTEMLTAVESAKKMEIPTYLIDRNIGQTFIKFKNIPWTEKFKMFILLIKGITLSPFIGEKVDLNKVPDDHIIDEAMKYLKKELPQFHRILIDERDQYMSHQVYHLHQKYDNVVVVVGAGHRKGMSARINRFFKGIEVF